MNSTQLCKSGKRRSSSWERTFSKLPVQNRDYRRFTLENVPLSAGASTNNKDLPATLAAAQNIKLHSTMQRTTRGKHLINLIKCCNLSGAWRSRGERRPVRCPSIQPSRSLALAAGLMELGLRRTTSRRRGSQVFHRSGSQVVCEWFRSVSQVVHK